MSPGLGRARLKVAKGCHPEPLVEVSPTKVEIVLLMVGEMKFGLKLTPSRSVDRYNRNT